MNSFFSTTPKSIRQLARAFLALTPCLWILILLLLVFWKSLAPLPESSFPFWPILRFTSTVDDFDPTPLPRTERNQVAIQAVVMPTRTVVVDEHEQIQEVWSNTAGNMHWYELYIREGSLTGPLVAYSPSVHTQYARLIPLLNWKEAGRVYAVGEAPSLSLAAQQLAAR